MELFVPSDKTQWEIIKEWIKDSDLLMLILGGRYGSIEPNSGKSYTHLEYEFALENNIPVFAIVLNEQLLADKKSADVELKVYEHEIKNPCIENYKLFKEKVMSNLVSIVENINQISTEVLLIIQEFIRKDEAEYHFRGWIRGDIAKDNLELYVEFNVRKFIDYKKRQGLSNLTIDSYNNDLRIFHNFFNETKITEIDVSNIKEFLIYREDYYSVKRRTTMEKI